MIKFYFFVIPWQHTVYIESRIVDINAVLFRRRWIILINSYYKCLLKYTTNVKSNQISHWTIKLHYQQIIQNWIDLLNKKGYVSCRVTYCRRMTNKIHTSDIRKQWKNNAGLTYLYLSVYTIRFTLSHAWKIEPQQSVITKSWTTFLTLVCKLSNVFESMLEIKCASIQSKTEQCIHCPIHCIRYLIYQLEL